MKHARRFRAFGLIAITLMAGLTLAAQTGDPTKDLLFKRLNEQFVPTVFSQDGSDVVTAGTVVTLQKDDLLVFRRPVEYCPISTYKNGKLSQGFGDQVDVALGDKLGDVNGFRSYPQKFLGFGEKFWIDGFGFGKDTILATVFTDPYDDGRYCGTVKFPYEKGHPPTPDEAVRMISEVLAPPAALDKPASDQGSQLVPGQGNDPIKAIQQRLRDTITLAGLDGNGDISTAGSVVSLQRGSLQMCATPNSGAPADAGAPANTYKNGKLSAGMFAWRLGLGISNIDPNTIPMRTYSAGEKFWVVNYKVKENGIEFKLWTDPDSNNIRYWSWLEFPFDKKQIPSADEVMKTIAEVLTVVPQDQGTSDQGNQGGQPAQSAQPAGTTVQYVVQGGGGGRLILLPSGSFSLLAPGGLHDSGQYSISGDTLTLTYNSGGRTAAFKIQGDNLNADTGQVWVHLGEGPPLAPAPEAAETPAPAPMADIPPPPPPTDAPPPTIAVGQTMDQVTAGFGEPLKVARVGAKVIFYYKDMKVTFTNGKVTNVE
jgi:hypothetical protein